MTRQLAWVAIVLGLLAGLAQVGAHNYPAEAPSFAPGDADCEQMDGGMVAQLQPLLARNQPGDAAVIERAVHGLNVARKHCAYGWSVTALENYRWLEQWLQEHR